MFISKKTSRVPFPLVEKKIHENASETHKQLTLYRNAVHTVEIFNRVRGNILALIGKNICVAAKSRVQ